MALSEHEITAVGISVREQVFQYLQACGDVNERAAKDPINVGIPIIAEASAERAKYRAAAYRVLSAIVNATEF